MYYFRVMMIALTTAGIVFLLTLSRQGLAGEKYQAVGQSVYVSPVQNLSTLYRRPYLVAPLGTLKANFDWSSLRIYWDGKLSVVKPIFGERSVGFFSPRPLGNGYHTAVLNLKDIYGNEKNLAWSILVVTPGIKDPGEGLWVEVNQKLQRIYVLKGSQVVREIICSTGQPQTPTPNGTFKILNRGNWFVTKERTAGARFWVSFKGFGRYMFHSIIYNPKGTAIIKREAAKLGRKASHGCIRMPLNDAKWFYENVPGGSSVIIHEPK